jgi:hypothetical protein
MKIYNGKYVTKAAEKFKMWQVSYSFSITKESNFYIFLKICNTVICFFYRVEKQWAFTQYFHEFVSMFIAGESY